MSLFTLRDWWRTSAGNDEEFDIGCMAIGNVDNEPGGETKIVVGSFQGILRVYSPKSRDYLADHLLLEMPLKAPILQLSIGRFTGDPGLSLAILHPRTIIVYRVQASGGIYALNRAFEHKLEHTAANFTGGPFGGSVGSDFLCVQSMDGQLSVFERETSAFTRYLPNFLVPGPIAYIEQMDAFVTCGASFEVECYKYQTLAAATSDRVATAGMPGAAPAAQQTGPQMVAKKVQPAWTFVLGEMALDIKPARLNPKSPLSTVDICVLGERSFFVLSETGQLRFEKRLDFVPTAMCPYYFDHAINRMNVMLASSTGTLVVLDVNKPGVTWSARGDTAPVQLAVSRFSDMPGLVAALDDRGGLSINYLGTTPQTKIVQVPENEFDYDSLESEHRSLLARIRDATARGPRAETVGDRIVLRTQVPQSLDQLRGADIDDPYSTQGGGARGGGRGGPRTITAMVFLSYTGRGEATDIVVTVDCPPPVTCRQPRVALPALQGGQRTPCVVSLVLECSPDCAPLGSVIHVSVAYLSDTGQQRVASTEFSVPMCLVCKAIPPVKDAQYKVTIDTNKPPPRLTALFEDVVSPGGVGGMSDMDSLGGGGGGGGGGSANVISFGYPDGTHCTVVVSKNAGRYRLQSNTYAGLGFVAEELCRRLEAYYASTATGSTSAHPAPSPLARSSSNEASQAQASTSQASIKISLVEPVPLGDLFEVIDSHFAVRKRIRELDVKLDRGASLYRAVEKRLLVRFKDRNPQPLNKLEDLLRAAHRDLLAQGDAMEAALTKLTAMDRSLSGALSVTLQLAKLSLGLSDKALEVLKGHLSPAVHDAEGVEPGWEEVAEAATTQLSRSLGKEGGAAGAAAAVIHVPEAVADTEKLKKNISAIFDKLSKGSSLV